MRFAATDRRMGAAVLWSALIVVSWALFSILFGGSMAHADDRGHHHDSAKPTTSQQQRETRATVNQVASHAAKGKPSSPRATARSEKAQRAENPEKTQRPQKVDRARSPQMVQQVQKVQRTQKAERTEKIQVPEQIQKPEKLQKAAQDVRETGEKATRAATRTTVVDSRDRHRDHNSRPGHQRRDARGTQAAHPHGDHERSTGVEHSPRPHAKTHGAHARTEGTARPVAPRPAPTAIVTVAATAAAPTTATADPASTQSSRGIPEDERPASDEAPALSSPPATPPSAGSPLASATASAALPPQDDDPHLAGGVLGALVGDDDPLPPGPVGKTDVSPD